MIALLSTDPYQAEGIFATPPPCDSFARILPVRFKTVESVAITPNDRQA